MASDKLISNPNVINAFKEYPDVSTVYVCDKGNVFFSPSARRNLKVVTRHDLEVSKLDTNKNDKK